MAIAMALEGEKFAQPVESNGGRFFSRGHIFRTEKEVGSGNL